MGLRSSSGKYNWHADIAFQDVKNTMSVVDGLPRKYTLDAVETPNFQRLKERLSPFTCGGR